MNKIPHPTREIAHFVARILAARQTTIEEIPHLIASVRNTIQAFHGGSAQPVLPAGDKTVTKPGEPPPRPPPKKGCGADGARDAPQRAAPPACPRHATVDAARR